MANLYDNQLGNTLSQNPYMDSYEYQRAMAQHQQAMIQQQMQALQGYTPPRPAEVQPDPVLLLL